MSAHPFRSTRNLSWQTRWSSMDPPELRSLLSGQALIREAAGCSRIVVLLSTPECALESGP
jgi:hypothetical protein